MSAAIAGHDVLGAHEAFLALARKERDLLCGRIADLEDGLTAVIRTSEDLKRENESLLQALKEKEGAPVAEPDGPSSEMAKAHTLITHALRAQDEDEPEKAARKFTSALQILQGRK